MKIKINLSLEEKEKLHDYIDDHFWSIYGRDTNTLSTTCRQLALAEGGMCWFFISSKYFLLHSYQVNLLLIYIVIFFLFDAAQYLSSSIEFKKLATKYGDEVENNSIQDIDVLKFPNNKLSIFFFNMKLIMLLISSSFLIFLILTKNICT